MRKIFLFLLIVISLVSCNKDAGDISSFMLTGNAVQKLSNNDVQHLKDKQTKIGDKLHIQIDNICEQKQYVKKLDPLNGVISVQVYMHPRLIKAESYGLGSIILQGEYLNQYFKIQQNFAYGQDVDDAINDMINLCHQANTYAKIQKGFFKRFADNPISAIFGDAYDFVTNIFVPKDNFFGKIASPFYRIACWSINKTQSLTNGLNLIFLIMFCNSFLILCVHILLIKKTRKNLIGIDIIRLFLEWVFFLSIIFYTVYLSTPNQGILYALNVYDIDVKNIELAFNAYTFKPSSLFIIIITSILWIALSLYDANNKYKRLEEAGASQEDLTKEMEEMGENIGDKIGSHSIAILFFFFLDRSILLGLFMFFLLRLTINVILDLKIVTAFLFKYSLKIVCVILFILFCGYQGLTSNNGNNQTSSNNKSDNKSKNNYSKTQNTSVAHNTVFSYAHLDSIKYMMAEDLYQLTKGMPRKKWKKLDIEQMQSGWNAYNRNLYIVSGEFYTGLNKNINVAGEVTSFKDKSALQGVIVNIKGTKKGTTTDKNGKFTINARPNDTLELMYLGYKTRYVPIKGCYTVYVSMNDVAFTDDYLTSSKFDKKLYDEYLQKGQYKHMSYMIGVHMARMNHSNGITSDIGLQDVYNIATTFHKGKPYKYSAATEKILIRSHHRKNLPIINKKNQDVAKTFIEKNAKNTKITKTKSGLQLYIINKGKGKKPHPLKSYVKIKYTAYRLNGEVFDKQDKPMEFKCSNLIAGLSEALTYISPGGKLIAYIPSNMAYRDKMMGSVLPGEMLIFEVELISVK